MPKSSDWLPNSRDGILAMAMDWITVCTPKQTDWNIPVTALTELANLRGFDGMPLRMSLMKHI
jgi:hypothetical protein